MTENRLAQYVGAILWSLSVIAGTLVIWDYDVITTGPLGFSVVAIITPFVGSIVGAWLMWIPDHFTNANALERERHRSTCPVCDGKPGFADERAYFDYLDAPVAQRPVADHDLEYVSIEDSPVAFLRQGTHYELRAANTLSGRMRPLCQLRTTQRVILSHDLQWSYLVQAKRRTGADTLEVDLRRGRPISNPGPLRRYLKERR
tara:strand:+ start:320 stop:928 length:609 start_codon:yes stop_codon:yes gene_type:complete